MGFEIVDGYLLGAPVSKPEAVAALLAERSPAPAAAPFYRALEAIGSRAADEALLALRLVLAGREPDDGAVRRLRALAGLARACATRDAAGVRTIRARDAAVLADLPGGNASDAAGFASLGAGATAAYRRELTATGRNG